MLTPALFSFRCAPSFSECHQTLPCIVPMLIRLQTRSGQTFSPWGGACVSPANPNFNLQRLLLDGIRRQHALSEAEEEHKPFGLSPLSSPEPSPCTSPKRSSENLPTIVPSTAPDSLSHPQPPPPNLPPGQSQKRGTAHYPTARHPTMTADAPQSRKTQKRKLRSKAVSHANRLQKRQRVHELAPLGGSQGRATKKHAAPSFPIKTAFESTDIPIVKTGYVALTQPKIAKAYTLEELVGEGSRLSFKLIRWDGW